MATISSWDTVDQIIRNEGRYEDDPPIVRIVEYNNMFNGGLAWGLIYSDEPKNRYHEGACIDPRTIWDQDKNQIQACQVHRGKNYPGMYCIRVEDCDECLVDCQHPHL